MFGLSFGEVLIILVVGLLVLGPSRLPQMARTLGKTLREFRKATTELRSSMEDEFYKMDDTQRPTVTSTTATAVPPPATVPARDPEPKA
jgi:sec-independent protein translocase protein TatB